MSTHACCAWVEGTFLSEGCHVCCLKIRLFERKSKLPGSPVWKCSCLKCQGIPLQIPGQPGDQLLSVPLKPTQAACSTKAPSCCNLWKLKERRGIGNKKLSTKQKNSFPHSPAPFTNLQECHWILKGKGKEDSGPRRVPVAAAQAIPLSLSYTDMSLRMSTGSMPVPVSMSYCGKGHTAKSVSCLVDLLLQYLLCWPCMTTRSRSTSEPACWSYTSMAATGDTSNITAWHSSSWVENSFSSPGF